MWDLIKDCWHLIRRRDSESACLLIIGIYHLLTDEDLKQMRDMFNAILENRKVQ